MADQFDYTGGRAFHETRPKYHETPEKPYARTLYHSLTRGERPAEKLRQGNIIPQPRFIYLWENKWLTASEIADICGVTAARVCVAFKDNVRVGGSPIMDRRPIKALEKGKKQK